MKRCYRRMVLALAAVATFGAMPAGWAADSDGYYVRSGSGAVVGSGAGECWSSTGAREGRCGEPETGHAPCPGAGCPPDTDRDGVSDAADACPDTRYGARVYGNGCPLDLDRDGVPYYLDRCQTTPPGVPVDGEGCATNLVLSDVQFAFGRSELPVRAREQLDDAVAALAVRTGVQALELAGHTDSVGAPGYNQRLSEARARAVAQYLWHRGVTLPMDVEGFGEGRPVAGNGNAVGRARNRRVEIMVEHDGDGADRRTSP